MPWKELRVMDLRKEFVLRAVNEMEVFQDLCQEYGISPKTGYKWKQRFIEYGLSGLSDESRRPELSPSELSESTVCEMVRLKQAHIHWGPRKIREVYHKLHGPGGLPSETSFKRVLDKAGLVERCPRRCASDAGRIQSRLLATEPNELWTVDFKGWWYTPGGKRCEPLTVRDAFSRFILGITVPPDATTVTVMSEFQHLFERYGLPGTIRSDNGRPFAVSSAPLGLSRLSVWWLALGIDLDRDDPGHPEQNGAHERMHRDIAGEVEGRIEGGLEENAAALEVWRCCYNEERPHEAIQMRRPAELYHRSSRPFTGTPERLEYPADLMDRQVTTVGTIQVSGCTIRISTALRGWNVGLKSIGQNLYSLYFGRLCLGQVDLSSQSFHVAPREPARKEPQ